MKKNPNCLGVEDKMMYWNEPTKEETPKRSNPSLLETISFVVLLPSAIKELYRALTKQKTLEQEESHRYGGRRCW